MAELIALCGIDGTGKSTQAGLLKSAFESDGLEVEIIWCRWDPVIAKPAIRVLDRLSRGRESRPRAAKAAATAGDPDRRRAIRRRLLGSNLGRRAWMAIMVVDYGLQVARRVRRALRTADVVIVDRYRHDVMVDLSAGRDLVDTPRLLRWLLPDPTHIIVLDAKEEVAHRRKPDSPDITYLRDRRALYLSMAYRSNLPVIDTKGSIESVSKELLAAVGSAGKVGASATWETRRTL